MRFSPIILCVGILSATFSVSAQNMSDQQILQSFREDVDITREELAGFAQSVMPFVAEMTATVNARRNDKDNPLTGRQETEFFLDQFPPLGEKIRTAAIDSLSREKYQKLQKRMFQLMQGTIDVAEKSDDLNALQGGYGSTMILLAAGQPDELELSPEQKELIRSIQKETTLKCDQIVQDAIGYSMETNPDFETQLEALFKQRAEAKTLEEILAVNKKIQAINDEMRKPAVAGLKQILVEGKQSYWRVLTDRQKDIHERMMEDMPDYLRARLPQVDADNANWQPTFGSWAPGMGAPEGMEKYREAKRRRSETGGRRFPGSE